MAKRYTELEKFLYSNPDEEVSFLAGAFHTVSTTAVMALGGWMPAIAYGVLTDRYFSKPFRDDKQTRHANVKGFAAGLATYLLVASVFPAESPLLSYKTDQGEVDNQVLSQSESATTILSPEIM